MLSSDDLEKNVISNLPLTLCRVRGYETALCNQITLFAHRGLGVSAP